MTMNKKYFIAVLLLMIAGLQTAWAQVMSVNLSNGKTISYETQGVESVTFYNAAGVIDGFVYVDLGLPSGTLWATCNVGAERPEEYGNYFAWGETEPKTSFGWSTYMLCEGTKETITKYNTADGLTTIKPAEDAATANSGENWQMPSKEQFEELINSNYTTTEWTTQNGVAGRLITSKSNGENIFLPAAGYYFNDNYKEGGNRGNYWSRSLHSNLYNAYELSIQSGNIYLGALERGYGMPIRPVRAKVHEYVDLGLPSGTLWATCNVGAENPEDYGDYFAWGETEPKSEYTWSNYFDDVYKDGGSFKKYYNGGFVELQSEDDAATVNWGSGWQIPNEAQKEELCSGNYTTKEWTTLNGVNGYRITSKSNGNSIFLPAAGYRYNTNIDRAGIIGCYWTRSLSSTSNESFELYFESNGTYNGKRVRCNGNSVRPVRKQ